MKFINRLLEWIFPSRKNIVIADSISEAFDKVRNIVDSTFPKGSYYTVKLVAIQKNVYEWEVEATVNRELYWHEMNMRWGR